MTSTAAPFAPPSFWGRPYHRRLEQVYQYLIAPGQRVLEIGCGAGDLLAAVRPSFGVGVDASPAALEEARRRHPALHFAASGADRLGLRGPFDAVILSDVVGDLEDVQSALEEVARVSGPHTRVFLNFYSRLWELPLKAARALGLARPTRSGNWLTVEDVANMLYLADLEVVRSWPEVLFPFRVPGVESFLNRALVRFWPFKYFALANFVMARPCPRPGAAPGGKAPVVSVVIPARNEAGHVAEMFHRIPRMGGETELVFVEGHSTDDTWAVLEKEVAAHPEWSCQLHRQTGKGKGDAVRKGFAAARGDVLMILDADLTMPPEDLSRYYRVLAEGKGDLVNGVRLVYPMEAGAMRFLNLVANKFFSLAFSWLLGQPVKDTLCGTKVLWKRDYERIARQRSYFGDFDPFGDFDLLFGAAKLGMKIVDLPIHYRERRYGTTNIQRWTHGWLLLRMLLFAFRKMKLA